MEWDEYIYIIQVKKKENLNPNSNCLQIMDVRERSSKTLENPEVFVTCYSKITQENTDWRVLEKDSLEGRDVHCNMNFCIASPWGKCIKCRLAKIKKNNN